MSAAERAFFEGDHCHHVAARDEQARLKRKRDDAQAVLRRLRSPVPSLRCSNCCKLGRQCDFCFSMAAQR